MLTLYINSNKERKPGPSRDLGITPVYIFQRCCVFHLHQGCQGFPDFTAACRFHVRTLLALCWPLTSDRRQAGPLFSFVFQQQLLHRFQIQREVHSRLAKGTGESNSQHQTFAVGLAVSPRGLGGKRLEARL